VTFRGAGVAVALRLRIRLRPSRPRRTCAGFWFFEEHTGIPKRLIVSAASTPAYRLGGTAQTFGHSGNPGWDVTAAKVRHFVLRLLETT
jgi:hypothetical protein